MEREEAGGRYSTVIPEEKGRGEGVGAAKRSLGRFESW